jgi:NtrC-family two-component system response regulator AlgB
VNIPLPLNILIIEGAAEARHALVKGLQDGGHRVVSMADASEYHCDKEASTFDLAFIAQDGGAEMRAVAKLRQRFPRIRVILTLPDTAASNGDPGGPDVFGTLRKPVSVECAREFARCVAGLRALEEDLAALKSAAGSAVPVPPIRPANTRMRRVMDRARQLACDAPSAPVLLRGEFGVGKRMLAHLIHQWGPHAAGPCILLRATCGDTPSSPRQAADLIRRRASRGTIVFEDIAEFTLAQQGEILALIAEEGTGVRTEGTIPPGIKIIATTSGDLSALVRKGAFRQELLSLLMDDTLYLPPLRERPEDIANLAEKMLAHFTHQYRRPEMLLEPEANLALVRYAWPGNVHELRNTLERVVLAAKKPEVGELELRLRSVPDPGYNRMGDLFSLDAMEKQHIQRVMRASSTLEEAARILQVDITTLWRKRHRYGI